MEFDVALSTLRSWVGKKVRVQIAGDSEIFFHAEGGELRESKPDAAQANPGLVIFDVGQDDGDVGVWLWRDHVDRVFWVDNAEEALGIETQGVMVTIRLETSAD